MAHASPDERPGSTRASLRPMLAAGLLPLLFLVACQSTGGGGGGSCAGAAPGSQTYVDCQNAAALTFSRRNGY